MGTVHGDQGEPCEHRDRSPGTTSDVGADVAELHRLALAFVPHGVCMYDADKRLIFCNDGYAKLYRLPPRLTERGTPLDEIIAYRSTAGNAPADLETYFDVVALARRTGSHAGTRIKLQDGRTIHLTHSPMPNGGYVAVHQDVTEHVDVEDKLRYLAGHDQLTGLYNRHAFGERLAAALCTTRCGRVIAIHCLDLDRFKAVNDALGHHAGDMLLQRVAKRLGECTDDGDIVGRLGGDEFIIMQLDVRDEDAARSLARRIVDRLARPYRLNRHLVSVGTSVGIALHPAHGATPDELMKNADRALYMAKAEGGDGFRMFRGKPPRDAAPLAQIA